MRIKHRFIEQNCSISKSNKIKILLGDYSIKYIYKEEDTVLGLQNSFEFIIYEDINLFDEIQNKLEPFDFFQEISTEYDKKDMDKAEWYTIYSLPCQYPQPDDDFGYLDVTFNLNNYCSNCGIGKIQNAPFRLLKEPKQKGNQFLSLFWEEDTLFVKDEIKNILEKENIKGIHFIHPVNKNNVTIEKYWQIIIETVLDNGFNSYNTTKETCKCGNIKYNHPPKEGYNFNGKIFCSAFDFNKSNEYFGSGGQADRINIISKKTYEIINKNRLKGIKIEPIIYG
jgi:hypothetical protein